MDVQQVLAKPDFRREILSYLRLSEVQILREVSKECRSHADAYKNNILQEILSKRNLQVLIVGLMSEKGKILNGRIGKLDCMKFGKDGRLAIRLDINWISGESDVLRIKLSNIHPFYNQPNYEDVYTCPPELANYSTKSSNIRESHARLLQWVLCFAKNFVGIADNVFVTEDIDDITNLPFSHPLIAHFSKRSFDYWQEPPFRCSRSPEALGTALDYVVGRAISNSDDLEEDSKRFARYDKVWTADGDEGRYMMRNFFHFMKYWGEERVTGKFWVTDVFKTGTLMVHLSDEKDPESLSTVYLVKGYSDTIGNMIKRSLHRLPALCSTTILPLYDCWTYDGIVNPIQTFNVGGSAEFENKLRQHVQKAIYSRSISWRGPTAERGLWNFETQPPPIPRLIVHEGDHYVLDWHDDTDRNNTSLNQISPQNIFAKEEMQIARQIAKRASEMGGTRKLNASAEKSQPPEGMPEELSVLTMRRLGYSREENPNGLCTLLDSRVEREPIHFFQFDVTDDMDVPAYTLKDSLQAILAAMEEAAPLPLATNIMIDDRSLLRPLDSILEKTFEEVGLCAPEIEYYGRGT